MTDKSFDEAVNEKRQQLEGLEHAIALTKKGGHLIGAFYAGMVAEGMPEEIALQMTKAFNDDFIQGMLNGTKPKQDAS
jgi:hypothetical protein